VTFPVIEPRDSWPANDVGGNTVINKETTKANTGIAFIFLAFIVFSPGEHEEMQTRAESSLQLDNVFAAGSRQHSRTRLP
jgi:hypothetical protein